MQDYFAAIDAMRTQKMWNSVARHKPLLLLLVLSKIAVGHSNRFVYHEIEAELTQLLQNFGERPHTKIAAYYPFVFLAGESLLWSCTLTRHDLHNPNSLSRTMVLPQVGHLPPDFLDFLLTDRNLGHVVGYLLQRFWNVNTHKAILHALRLEYLEREILEMGQLADAPSFDPMLVLSAFGIESPGQVLYRDFYYWILEEARPVSPGHCLVVSQALRRDFWELSLPEQAHLPRVIHTTRRLISKRHRPDGYNIAMNSGGAAGQRIFRFHCHVIPHYSGGTGDSLCDQRPHFKDIGIAG